MEPQFFTAGAWEPAVQQAVSRYNERVRFLNALKYELEDIERENRRPPKESFWGNVEYKPYISTIPLREKILTEKLYLSEEYQRLLALGSGVR